MLTRMSGGTWMMEIRMLSFSSSCQRSIVHIYIEKKFIVHPRYIGAQRASDAQRLSAPRASCLHEIDALAAAKVAERAKARRVAAL